MEDKILVSVITLAFNHEEYIRQCIESIVSQKTNFKFELIIHDDASTDKTADIIREYQEKYPDIVKPILQKENQYSRGGNIGERFLYPMAQGKYFAECEGDDYWCDPNKLQKQVDFLETHPEYSSCVHKCKQFNCLTNLFVNSFPQVNTECDFSTEEIILGGGGLFGTNTVVYCRDSLQDMQKNFWKLSPVGDYPLALSIATKGKVHYFPDEMSVYRIFVKGSWSSRTMIGPEAYTRRLDHISKMRESLKAFDEHTEHKYTDTIQEKIDLNDFNLYWDFGKWTLLKTTSHYKQRSFIGKLKAAYHCFKVSFK